MHIDTWLWRVFCEDWNSNVIFWSASFTFICQFHLPAFIFVRGTNKVESFFAHWFCVRMQEGCSPWNFFAIVTCFKGLFCLNNADGEKVLFLSRLLKCIIGIFEGVSFRRIYFSFFYLFCVSYKIPYMFRITNKIKSVLITTMFYWNNKNCCNSVLMLQVQFN